MINELITNNQDYFQKFNEHTEEGFVDVRGYIKNAPETFIFQFIGERNCGKSYSTEHFIHDFSQMGYEFIYMRRNKDRELKKAKDRLFNCVEDSKIVCDGFDYYWKEDGVKRLCGYGIPLSSVPKGMEFPNVKIIYFDEFTITNRTLRYLPTEFEVFGEFYETVTRRRKDVITIMCGNARDFFSPYSLGWNIALGDGQKRWTSPNKMVKYNMVEVNSSALNRSNTVAGQLFAGTNYDKSSNNEFIDNDSSNIKKKPAGCRYWCTIIDNGNEFTAWIDRNDIYISKDKGLKIARYTLDKSNTNETQTLFQRQNNQIAMIRYAGINGRLFYESQKVKAEFKEILGVILRYV